MEEWEKAPSNEVYANMEQMRIIRSSMYDCIKRGMYDTVGSLVMWYGFEHLQAIKHKLTKEEWKKCEEFLFQFHT